MNRRQLIKSILGFSGLIVLPVSWAQRKRSLQVDQNLAPLRLLDTHIAGFAYYEGESLLAQLKSGDALELCRNPDNIYGPQAIEIYWNRQMLGHKPKIANMGVAQMLDRGEKLNASIIRVDAQKSPWRPVEVRVYWG